MNILFTDEEILTAKSRDKLPLKCYHCKLTFRRFKGQIQSVLKNPNQKGAGSRQLRFCSRKCRMHFENPPQYVQCAQCDKQIRKTPKEIRKTKLHFCNHSCHAKYQNVHKTTGTRRSKLEKWLQIQLTTLFPTLDIHYNRTDAINAELDIYIPTLKLAFELNGIFHYKPIYGPKKLAAMKRNDKRKYKACLKKGISLRTLNTSKENNFNTISAQKHLNIIKNLVCKEGIEPS